MTEKIEPTKKNTWHKDMPLISLGWELAIPIFGGALLGFKIDQNIGTKYTFTLIFLVVGVFTGYYNLYKHIHLEMLRTRAAKQKTWQEEKGL